MAGARIIDFNSSFEKDEDIEEELNNIVTTVGVEIVNDERLHTEENTVRVQHLLYTYKLLKYLTKDIPDSSVSYKVHEPFNSVGSVTLICRSANFTKPEWFMKAAELANNFEVYPRTDGKIALAFAFHGLTK